VVDITADINQTRAMRIAHRRIEGFAQQFGEAHRNLARHAAFPLVLTPDLLYQIWANFVPEAPWIAVAHVLLSRLCRQVGYEMYEMDIADRNLLLRELKEQFRQERFDELGEFLLDYVAQRLTDDDEDTQDLREAQKWTALAYTKPDEAVQELAQRLSERVKQEDIGEVLRLATLVETLAEPLLEAGFEPLLIYTNGMATLVRGNQESAASQFKKLLVQSHKVQITGVYLDVPRVITDKKHQTVQPKINSYFLPCSFFRDVIGDTDIIFEAGQELYQLDSDSVAKVRSDWQGVQLIMIIRRQDFEDMTLQLWGSYNGKALAEQLKMQEFQFLHQIRVQFEVDQNLEFTLRFCNGNPHYLIPPANEFNSLDAGQKIKAEAVISEGKVVCDIAVIFEAAYVIIFEAAKDYSKEIEVFWVEKVTDQDEKLTEKETKVTEKRQGLISAPLPPFPLSGKHMFYFHCPDSNTWELIGELPKPKNKTEYPCIYRVTLDEKGILQIHAGEVPYWEGDNQEGLKQEGYVFRVVMNM
jgi:hypothetical protein